MIGTNIFEVVFLVRYYMILELPMPRIKAPKN